MSTTIRAAVCAAWNEPMVIRDDVQIADAGPGQVRVALSASGVCHTDLAMWNQSIAMPQLPCVLGHEGAGVVVEVGDGVTNVSVGDHVVVIMPTCGHCRFCLRGEGFMCPNAMELGRMPAPFTVDGQSTISGVFLGTFAEQTVVSARSVVPIAPDLPLDVASLIGCGVLTGVGAVFNTARVEIGSSVLVIGCGGVGSSIIQAARVAGAAQIAAIDLSPEKLEQAQRFGATHVGTPDDIPALITQLTGGDGFDYTFEAIGRSDTIRLSIDSTRRAGDVIVVGVGRQDDVVEVDAFEWVFGAKNIRGSLYGGADPTVEVDRILRLWKAGLLDLSGLVSSRVPLSEANAAFDTLSGGGSGIRTIIDYSA